jgi:hypothetical protein
MLLNMDARLCLAVGGAYDWREETTAVTTNLCHHRHGKNSVKRILKGFYDDGLNTLEIARILGVHDAHIYRAKRGHVTPTLMAALVDGGYMLPKPKEVGFYCRVPKGVDVEKFRAAMRRYKCLAIGESI